MFTKSQKHNGSSYDMKTRVVGHFLHVIAFNVAGMECKEGRKGGRKEGSEQVKREEGRKYVRK